jgi:hypothetical protein
MHKAIHAAVIGIAVVGAPSAAFAQETQPYSPGYLQPYPQTYWSGTTQEPASPNAAAAFPSDVPQPASLDPDGSGGINRSVDVNGVSPSETPWFLRRCPLSAGCR